MLRRICALMMTALMLFAFPALAQESPSVNDCVFVAGEGAEVRYSLPQMMEISLKITDGQQEVAQILTSRKMIAGNHALSLDGLFFGDTPLSGAYDLVLTADGSEYTARFTVMEQAQPAPAAFEALIPTPAYESAHRPNHENCYWCTPLDITAEAAAQGLGTCILGWLDDEKLRKICGLEQPVRLVITVGYPADEPRPKKRKSLEELVTEQ